MFNNLKYRETVNEKRKEKRAIRRLMLREKNERGQPPLSIYKKIVQEENWRRDVWKSGERKMSLDNCVAK